MQALMVVLFLSSYLSSYSIYIMNTEFPRFENYWPAVASVTFTATSVPVIVSVMNYG